MKEQGRGPRVADHLRERLADIIRAEMRDPRVGMVSVNDVRVTRDLAYADIFVSSLGVDDEKAKKELVTVLEHAAGFLQAFPSRLLMRAGPWRLSRRSNGSFGSRSRATSRVG